MEGETGEETYKSIECLGMAPREGEEEVGGSG